MPFDEFASSLRFSLRAITLRFVPSFVSVFSMRTSSLVHSRRLTVLPAICCSSNHIRLINTGITLAQKQKMLCLLQSRRCCLCGCGLDDHGAGGGEAAGVYGGGQAAIFVSMPRRFSIARTRSMR